MKKAEKALDNRVSGILSLRLSHSMLSFFQKPDLVAAESKIQHAQRKLRNHEATRESAAKDAKKQEDRLAGLRKDLIVEQKAADVARGKKGAIIFCHILNLCIRCCPKGFRKEYVFERRESAGVPTLVSAHDTT